MAIDDQEWRPGSFTKNFSWGGGNGLRELYDIIRIGFDNRLVDVPRSEFRARVTALGRPDYIPINFFLFNRTRAETDWLIVDELVFQALSFDHSKRFDRLALSAFLLSMVGEWKGASAYQQRPALWAHHYIADRVGSSFNWDTRRISADDIQRFIQADKRYVGQTSRKLATNLNYLFHVGEISDMTSKHVERWWIDALFVALDRAIEMRRLNGLPVNEKNYESYIQEAGFFNISGKQSAEKKLAVPHIVRLYTACGARERFNEEHIRERAVTKVADIQRWLSNATDPVAALHPSNPRIVKTIPRPCAMLAQLAGFLTLDLHDLESADFSELVRGNLQAALQKLKEQGIRPSMSAEELMQLMRGE